MEIERKFWIQSLPDLPEENCSAVDQGYLCTEPVEPVSYTHLLVLQVEPIEEDETEHHSARAEAVIRTTYELIEHYCELSTKVSSDIMQMCIRDRISWWRTT